MPKKRTQPREHPVEKTGLRAAQISREHKDLATSEIEFRLKCVTDKIAAYEKSETELVAQLTELRKAIKNSREDVVGFTALLNARGC